MFFFGKTYLNLFRQDIKKIFLLKAFQQSLNRKAFQQSLNRGQKTAEKPNFGKKSLPLHRSRFKSLFSIFCFDFLHIDPSNNFCFCKFFAKCLKSEGERLKVKFWSSEMVKIGRGQQNYRRCRCRHRLQSFAIMKKTV